jgi:hypothetical protein
MATGAGTTNHYLFGVKIYLDTEKPQDTTIGLYTAGGVSCFRWIQETTANTTDVWKVGILAEDGIGAIEQSADFRRGGNIAQIKGLDVKITNIVDVSTIIYQVWKKLSDAKIYFAGLKMEVIEIDLDIAHAGTNANETIRYTGICEAPTGWNETQLTIPVVNAYYKRKSNLATVIDPNDSSYQYAEDGVKGEIIPITFGFFKGFNIGISRDSNTGELTGLPALDRKAKFVRTTKTEKIWNTGELQKIMVSGVNQQFQFSEKRNPLGTCSPIGVTSFPITYKNGHNIYRFQYSRTQAQINFPPNEDGQVQAFIYAIIWTWTGYAALPRYQYIKVMSGTGAGKYRKIVNMCLVSTYSPYIEITIESAFETDLETSGANQSYIQLVDVNYIYNIDVWKCWNYIGSLGNIINGSLPFNLELFSELNNKFISIPAYSFKASSTTSKNQIQIDSTMSETSPDQLISFFMYRPSKITYLDAIQKNSEMMDRDFNSYKLIFNNTSPLVNVYLPKIPPEMDFTNVYVGIRCKSTNSVNKFTLSIMSRKFLSSGADQTISIGSVNEIDDIPDFYYTSNIPPTSNLNFFMSGTGTGYNTFAFSNITKDNYASYEEVQFQFNGVSGLSGLRIYEIVIMFKGSSDITDSIFSAHSGRIFNDTWGTRKDSDSLIADPVDIFEHVCRLMNGSETGQIANWGKEYITTPFVNTSSNEGGFDWIGLNPARLYKPGRQILNYDDAWSGKILESLCKQFRLCSFQNAEGLECVGSVETIKTTIAVNITLADIIDGSLGDIEETNPQDIFCQPVINFNFNASTDKFDNVIQITNADASSYIEGYVTGFTGDSAEEMWNKAHALWNYYRLIETPPSELTDCYWITEMDDAVRYVMHWFEWMGVYRSSDDATGIYRVSPKKRIPFSVPYYIGKSWFVSMHLTLSLPHQTNGSAVQCLLEKVHLDVNKQQVSVVAIIIDETNKISFYIQNSYDSHVAVGWNDWQDSFKTQTEEPTQNYDIQGAD